MGNSNTNLRLEAFSDGVFAVAITLLVIEIKVPSIEAISTTNNLWLALQHLIPSFFAFFLSFMIIFITWVNHHGTLKLIHKSSSAFIYANGFLLLTIAIFPFTTSLLSEYLFTDHATAAVVVYAAINALQSLAWIFLGHAALNPIPLTKDEKSTISARLSQKSSYISLVINILLVIIAFWFPKIVALMIGGLWIGWLIYGIRIKHE